MGILKNLMYRLEWQNLLPRQDLLLSPNSSRHVAVAASPDRVVAYVPDSSSYVSLSTPPSIESPIAYWINPATSDTARVETWTDEPHVPPTVMDWLLVLESEIETDEEPDSTSDIAFRAYPVPNPSKADVRIFVESPSNGAVTLRLYDVVGRLVFSNEQTLGAGVNSLAIPPLPAGIYVVGIALQDDGGRLMGKRRFKFTSL